MTLDSDPDVPPAAADGGPPPDPRFAFIDLARLGRNTGWSYLRGISWVVLFYGLGAAVAIVAMTWLVGRYPTAMTPAIIFGSLASIDVMLIGAYLAARRSHRRPFMSLVAPDLRLDWRRVVAGAVFWALILAVGIVVMIVNGTLRPAWDARLPWYGLAILAMVPLQSATEEIVFRGYLTQAVGQLVRSRITVAVIVAIPFAALHGVPYGALSFPSYVMMSLMLSAVSLADRRLELAIGAHIGNNLIAAFPEALPDDLLVRSRLSTLLCQTIGWDDLLAQAVSSLAFLALCFAAVRLLNRRSRAPD